MVHKLQKNPHCSGKRTFNSQLISYIACDTSSVANPTATTQRFQQQAPNITRHPEANFPSRNDFKPQINALFPKGKYIVPLRHEPQPTWLSSNHIAAQHDLFKGFLYFSGNRYLEIILRLQE